MKKREFRAQIVEDFKRKWLACAAEDEHTSIGAARMAYGGEDLDALDARISGKEVTLVQSDCGFAESDFFEKEDDNFVMFRSLWVAK